MKKKKRKLFIVDKKKKKRKKGRKNWRREKPHIMKFHLYERNFI